MLDVQDKVVAITGAARGLGQEFAVSLTAGGARIVAGDINDCAETLDLVSKTGARESGSSSTSPMPLRPRR
jgi:p-cumic alcohol dehydrogenase